MSRVAGIGIPTLDRIVGVPEPPRPDATMCVEQLGAHGGGQVATALVAVARLGHGAALVGAVGDDPDGRAIVDGLAAAGVDTRAVARVPGGRSAASMVLVGPAGERSILYDPGTVEPPLDGRSLALLAGADGVLLAGSQPFTRVAAARVRTGAALVLIDLDAWDEDVTDLVPAVDVAIASAQYAASRARTPEQVVRDLLGLGARTAVVTLGAGGAIGATASESHREPAYEVDVVDTTGAGDVYHGAFLVAALERRPLAEAMRFAAAVAGLSCRAVGGRAGIPDRREVDAALAAAAGAV